MRARRGLSLGENCYPRFPVSASSSSLALPAARVLAAGRGVFVHEYICHAGPGDRPFEERHDRFTVAAVVAGSFVYRTETGRGLLHPGAVLLGNVGACFECGHEHSRGDRCISFQFEPDVFGELAATATGSGRFRFRAAMLPSLDPLLPLVATAAHAAARGATGAAAPSLLFEELAMRVAEIALGVASGGAAAPAPPPQVSGRDERRIADVLRAIEDHAAEPLDLDQLAALAGLSKYHFLRTFRRVVGRSPYQYLLAARMHRAALALLESDQPISEIAFAAGFGDLSTFNRRFRDSFGATPREFRQRGGARA
jgi:AraC-like DNA-binding protein